MTTKAPERIWAETISHSLLHAWVEGNWHSDEGAFGGVQYIRADLSSSPEVVKELVVPEEGVGRIVIYEGGIG